MSEVDRSSDTADGASTDDWQAAWQPLIDAVGRDFAETDIIGADDVERGTIRRFLEPIELGCPIHVDDAAAQAAGYDGVVAPVSSVLLYTLAPMWNPGDPPLFDAAGRNVQPARSAVQPDTGGLGPTTTGYFATDMEFDFLADMKVGDRLRRSGNVLLSCKPRATRVGQGAFTTWQWNVLNQRDELVARIRTTLYFYNPVEAAEPGDSNHTREESS